MWVIFENLLLRMGYNLSWMLKKTLSFFIIVSLVAPLFYAPYQARKVSAVVPAAPVVDIKALIERITDGIAMTMARQMVDRMVASTVKWAQNGFEGNPAYVTDPKTYFTDLADQTAGQFIKGSELGMLCSPFQANIRLSLVQQYYQPEQFQCTLTDVVGNIENFLEDFDQGGWEAWFSMTQTPTNNPYGAYLAAKLELDNRLANAVGLKQQELDWNQGFLSWSDCARKNEATEYVDEWNPETEEYEHIANPNHVSGKAVGECIARGPTQTPGSLIKGQLDKVLPSGLEGLITVQHMDQLVSAFASGLLEKYVFGPDGIFKKDNTPDPNQGGRTQIDIDADNVFDGLDNNGDGQLDICYFGGTTSSLGPPCVGSQGHLGNEDTTAPTQCAFATSEGNDSGAPSTIDESSIIWDENPGTGNWSVTGNLSSVATGADSITLNYDKASSWPQIGFDFLGCPNGATSGANCAPVVGNAWVIAWRNGAWHASTFEWLRPGQTQKGTENLIGADGTLKGVLGNFSPRTGETYGFVVTTPARNGVTGSVNERTNIVTMTWNGPICSSGL